MTLQEAYFVSEIVVGVAVIVSIVFVAMELRQNTYMLRKSMADQREQRLNWLHETLATNNEFRRIQSRIGREWDQFDDDERYRAVLIGIRVLRSQLNELVGHFDGQISNDELRSLKWNMVIAKNRPHVKAAYNAIKESYPDKVQKYWEELDTSNAPPAYGEMVAAVDRS